MGRPRDLNVAAVPPTEMKLTDLYSELSDLSVGGPSDVGVAEVPSTIVGLDDLRVAVPSENFAEVPHTGLADQEIKLSGKWIQKLQS